MKNLLVRASICLLAIVGTHLSTAAQLDNQWDQGPKLYCGTDTTGFQGENGQLAVARTSGASIVGTVQIFNLDVPLNGITFGKFSLWAGQPETIGSVVGDTLRKVSVSTPPAVLNTVQPGSASFSAACCNEQMTLFKGKLYHAHYNDAIQQLAIDASGNSEVAQTYPQTDVVGMASDGSKIWISKWSEKQVGTWDPSTNVFTPVFSTSADAGALAWDVKSGVLWVGMLGGSIVPYNATGTQLGSGFQPFGSISGTIDGMAFVPARPSAGAAVKLQ
jgi:hypothetical protein